MKYYLGIDPGKTSGAVVLLGKGRIVAFQVTPKIGDQVDLRETAKFFRKVRRFMKKGHEVHAVMEKLHGLPNQKLSVIWELARHCGILEGLLGDKEIPYSMVIPRTWQKEMFKGTKMLKKKEKGLWKNDTKGTARIVAQKLFPNQNLLATKRSKVPHDGIVDALLIAEYGRRLNL